MNVITEREGSSVYAKLSGEIDHHSAKSVREAIDAELNCGKVKELVLDFMDVSFMDSSGLGVIFGRYNKLAAHGGKLILKNVPKRIERILRMAGVYTLIDKNETNEEGRHSNSRRGKCRGEFNE